jgi:hypothetical protein
MAVLFVVATGLAGILAARQRDAFNEWRQWRRFPAAARLVEAMSPPQSVVFAWNHSGSIRYYGERVTIRLDLFDPAGIDSALAWLNAAGTHAYGVFEDWEVVQLRERFSSRGIGSLLETPTLIYRAYVGGPIVEFFDFSSPPLRGSAPRMMTEPVPTRLRSTPSGQTPTISFHTPKGRQAP